MTIKELENRTGMTRANIRFYEGEGLLAPKRLDNGYRDYSEEDAGTLEKIRLLRQLQLDIDTIRKVQQGALTLEQALFTQLTRLEGDRAALERAAEVCRALEQSGVEYAALEPRPWLAQLQPPARPSLPEPPAPADPPEDVRDVEPRACYCPWQRLFARSLDMALYDTIINVTYLLITRNQDLIQLQMGSAIARWVWGVAMLALTLALEPLWLHFWGWTPGKWLFGLKLRDEDGSKLSIAQAWARCWQLAWEGYGWNIPIVDLWLMWRRRKAGLDGLDCPWDSEEGYRYTKEERRFGGLVFVAARAALPGLLVLAMLFAALPPCRGELTVAEFARNYDHFLQMLYPRSDYPEQPTLDQEGRWRDRAGYGGVTVHYSGSTIVAVGGSLHAVQGGAMDTLVWDEPAFTVENGRVTAVTLHLENVGTDIFVSSGSRELLALLAMSGSVDGLDLFNFNVDGWRNAVELLPCWEDAEADWRGLHISQQAEYSGYRNMGQVLWQEDENVPCRCEKTVTISLAE